MTEYEKNFESEQRRIIRAARELFYPKDVVEQLKNAKTLAELDRIMSSARKKFYD